MADTLRSATAQTWRRKEIIVIDDGSTDQTLRIARQFESQGVRVYSKRNEGAASSRNLALLLSKGDYIQWLDADDLLAPDKIALQMNSVRHMKASEYSFLRLGEGSSIDTIGRSSFRLLYGAISLPWSGCCARWGTIFSCRPLRGLSVAN